MNATMDFTGKEIVAGVVYTGDDGKATELFVGLRMEDGRVIAGTVTLAHARDLAFALLHMVHSIKNGEPPPSQNIEIKAKA